MGNAAEVMKGKDLEGSGICLDGQENRNLGSGILS
jgi:hypothetical protein